MYFLATRIFYMENNIKTDANFIEILTSKIKDNKNTIISIVFLLLIFLSVIIFFNYKANIDHKEISEKYIKAGIFLSQKENNESNRIYKEIILSKNKFYAVLSLNSILDNDLENSNEEIFRLFKIVENTKIDKKEKDLVKLKKALFLNKISKTAEGNKLLEEMISENSIWKNVALEMLTK